MADSVTAWPVARDAAVVNYDHRAFEGFADHVRGADIVAHIFVAVFTAGQRAIKSVDHNKGRAGSLDWPLISVMSCLWS